MTDLDALFRPLPDVAAPSALKLPAALTAELGLEMSAKPDVPTLWSVVTPLQLLVAAALVALGALVAVWWSGSRTPNKQSLLAPAAAPAPIPDIVTRVRDVARAHTGPLMQELEDTVALETKEFKKPLPVAVPKSVVAPPPARPMTELERANETGVWLRDGLAARGVAPDAVAAIVALAVRSILKPEAAEPKPTLETKSIPIPQPQIAAPPRGVISTRGLVLPVYDPSDADETQTAGTKTGRINPAADDRVKQMLKERGLDKSDA